MPNNPVIVVLRAGTVILAVVRYYRIRYTVTTLILFTSSSFCVAECKAVSM